MPNRSRNDDDPNVTAFNIVRDAVGDVPTTGPEAFAALIREMAGLLSDGATPDDLAERFWPQMEEIVHAGAAAALGSRGGKKGGKARAASLSDERRSEIARKAARARWGSGTGSDDL